MDFNKQDMRNYLEINSQGETRAEEKEYRHKKSVEQMNSYQGTWLTRLRNKVQFLGRGRRVQGKIGNGGKLKGSFEIKKVFYGITTSLVGLVMIGLVYNLFQGNLVGWQRGMFGTLEENQGVFTNEILGAEEKLHDTYKSEEEVIAKSKYDKNKIRDIKLIGKQPYQEYMVYVYSSDGMKNGAFDKYVKLAEQEGSTFPVPIYRISTELTDKSFIVDTLGEDEPGFIIYRDNTGEVELDSYINDPDLFGGIEEYINQLIREDDEYLKNKVGNYNKSRWKLGADVQITE